MSEPQEVFYMPDLLVTWPWPRQINSHYEDVSTESNAWVHTFKAFSEHSQKIFDKCDFGRLASLAFPTASKERLRTSCDLMNIFFIIEEYTDVASPDVIRELVNVIIDALKNPSKPRPHGETILGEITRQFWTLAIETAPLDAQDHFINAFSDYLNSVVTQAVDRYGRVHTIESYLAIRRENIGSRPCYAIAEFDLSLSDEALHHPIMKELEELITNMLIIGNDVVSYNKEQAIGDDKFNIVTIAIRQFNMNIDNAMQWVGSYQALLQARYMEQLKIVPSFGPEMDREITSFVLHLSNWPRANDCWSFETVRYFGREGLDVQKSRRVVLLPKLV